MKAVGLSRYLPVSDAQSFLDLDLPKPVPAGRDILVAVEAISINPVDAKVRSPKDKVEAAPRVIGYDAAGIVAAVGPDATLFKPGDEVWYAGDITRPGTNQEFHLVDERIVGRKPRTLGFAEAAALPLTAITAYEAFFDRLRIDRDEGHGHSAGPGRSGRAPPSHEREGDGRGGPLRPPSQDSGLKGLSGISNDMRALEASSDPRAKQAIDSFVFRVRREIGGMAAVLEGLDAIVFCGGIGENSPAVREYVLEAMEWIGIELDLDRNRANEGVISSDRSRVRAFVIRTNEDLMIARHAARPLTGLQAAPGAVMRTFEPETAAPR